MNNTNAADSVYPHRHAVPHVDGMTKREEFAKAALQGLLSNDQIVHLVPAEDLHVVANHAVQMADWLIEALNEKRT